MKGFLLDMGMGVSYSYRDDLSVMYHIHVHPQFELYLCVDDVTQHSVVNGASYSCEYPCAILSAPFTIHSMSCEESSSASYGRYVFYFDESVLSSLSSHLPPEVLSPNVGLLFPLTTQQAAYLKNYIDTATRQSPTSLEDQLTLAFVINKLFDFCPSSKIITVGSSSFYMQEVLQYIAENFNSDSAADIVAERFNVSRSKLDRDFKYFTGLTTHKFVELCRLNHAKYLLVHENDFSIDKICEECGFFGKTHFFPFFKKHTGMTPLEFRRASSKEDQPSKQ